MKPPFLQVLVDQTWCTNRGEDKFNEEIGRNKFVEEKNGINPKKNLPRLIHPLWIPHGVSEMWTYDTSKGGSALSLAHGA